MPSENDTINSTIKKIAFHWSIKAIKKEIKTKSEFSFSHVYAETTKRMANDLDMKKPSSGEIPARFSKKCNFVLDAIKVSVNEALTTGSFPDSLKWANVRTIYKKVNPFDQTNYRPVSTLPLLLKVYERVIYEQASNYFEPVFNKILCG